MKKYGNIRCDCGNVSSADIRSNPEDKVIHSFRETDTGFICSECDNWLDEVSSEWLDDVADEEFGLEEIDDEQDDDLYSD